MLAVMFLDLDRFKLINDTMGHNLGDQLLKKVAERVGQTLRAGDTLARLGGDEFLILLPEIKNDQEVVSVSERILKVFSQPILMDDNEVYMSTSIGISLYPRDGTDMETLVKQADTAMYFAKEKGRNNYQFFTHELNIKANERLTTEYSLRKALAREEFVLHYQPQVDFESGCIVGLEALVRWNSKEQGIISPAAFIPIAEETGLIVPIGEWVLRAACLQNVAWQLQGYPPMRMAVNISDRQFRESYASGFGQPTDGTNRDPDAEVPADARWPPPQNRHRRYPADLEDRPVTTRKSGSGERTKGSGGQTADPATMRSEQSWVVILIPGDHSPGAIVR